MTTPAVPTARPSTRRLERLRGLVGNAKRGPLARDDGWLEVLVVVIAAGLAGFSLREYIAPDYKVEILPALLAMETDGLRGALDNLPGYPAIALLEVLLGEVAMVFGATEAGVWRFLSAIGISSIALAIIAALPYVRATEIPRG
ncbi:MAG: hypothetical protein JHD16_13885, partial [Solirubrobacteraceae bacterium]|nr:hypothetical protein [Solirubrobacteraceae bacterium]